MLNATDSITGAYFSGRESIAPPAQRRPVTGATPLHWLTFNKVAKHNIRDLSFSLPLQRFVCLSGVSGSGKSTLLDNVIDQGVLAQRLQLTDDPANIGSITGTERFSAIVLVDQSPLSRTPRSNPSLYTEAWELIRELYAATPNWVQGTPSYTEAA